MADAATVRQSTCVAIDGHAILLDGPPGCGKSTLALKLVDRGAVLVGDDGVSLAIRDGALWAAPPPNTAGCIEVRNVGIVERPTCEARVALRLELSPEAPRFVDRAERQSIEGVALPSLMFDPTIPASAIRAEIALHRYGE